MRTADLIGPALDWAVAQCEGVTWSPLWKRFMVPCPDNAALMMFFEPSTTWSQGGPIIEREKLSMEYLRGDPCCDDGWYAEKEQYKAPFGRGDTPLIAAMRCYVASKLGDEVEVPEELR